LRLTSERFSGEYFRFIIRDNNVTKKRNLLRLTDVS